MKPATILTVGLLSIGIARIADAQALPELPKPTDEHKWLKKFVGHWEMTSKGVMGEGQPPVETKGTIKSEMLGGFWVVNTMTGDVAGMKFKGMQTVGYDTKKKKYVGTWVDSMNNYLWKYQGTVDKSGKKLVLEADGPDMVVPNKTTKYRDAYEFKSGDEMLVTSSMQKPDGKWMTFMTGTAKRKKSKQR